MVLSLDTAESFDMVMRHYTPMVYRIAFSRLANAVDCEDVTQEVFVRYFRANLTYESEEHRKAWLIRCAVNTSINFVTSAHKKHSGNLENIENYAESEILSANVTENEFEKQQLRQTVLNAVLQLPEKYRIPVHLFYYEDLPTAQIAAITNTRESTVRSQLARARKLLENLLKGVEF